MAVTFSSYGPFNGSPYYSDSWRVFMSGVAVPGVLRGVREELRPFGDSSGMQIKIRPGEIWAQGYHGTQATEVIVTIPAAHATLARRDRVVWRVVYDSGGGAAGVGGKIEFDVLQGTTTAGVTDPLLVQPPDITRNSAIYEGSLAVVNVDPAVGGIAATKVFDARMYGGTNVPPLRDDSSTYGDKVSTIRRVEAAGAGPTLNVGNVMHVFLTSSTRDQTVTKARIHANGGTLVGGDSFQLGVYLGYTPFELSLFDTVSFTSWSAGTVHQTNLSGSGILVRAGQFVALGLRKIGSASSPVPASSQAVGNGSTDFLNQGTTPPPSGDGFWSTINKTGVTSMPSRINGHDGTWLKGNSYIWLALA